MDYFKDQRPLITEFRRRVTMAAHLLEHEGSFNPTNAENAIAQAFSANGTREDKKAILKVIETAVVMSKAVEGQILSAEQGWATSDLRAARVKQIERYEQWKGWVHASVRWILSAAIAVFIYSAAVALQATFPEIVKVPIHDWIKQPEENTGSKS